MYIDKLNNVVYKYNKKYLRKLKIKPLGAIGKNDKFEAGNCVKISRTKNIFAKDYTPN